MPRLKTERYLDCPIDGCVVRPRGPYALRLHMRVHSDERPYKCNEERCDASFKRKEHLKDHDVIHHLDSDMHKCDEANCEAQFKIYHNLQAHQRVVHQNIRNVICEFEGCDRTFTDKSKLENHSRVHSGDRPFVCPIENCELAFSHLSTLKYHINVHNGVKPYICSYEGCQSSFSDPGSLKKHEMIHLIVKPISCTDTNCDATFTRNEHFRSHYESHHTQQAAFRHKKEEAAIENVLKLNEIEYVREHRVDFRCVNDPEGLCARIDFLLLENAKIICVEIDEDQHKDRPIICECARVAKIFESLALEGNSLPVVFLRFNPNKYTLDGKQQSITKNIRFDKLLDELKYIKNQDDLPPLSIKYMFYDTISINNVYRACCLNDPEYFPALRECVTGTIVG